MKPLSHPRRFSFLCSTLGALAGLALAAGCGRSAAPPDAAALLQEGWNKFRLGEYDQSLKMFDRALAIPELAAEARVQALHGKATVCDLRQPVPSQDDEQAAALYREVIAADPGHDLAAWSSLALTRMQHLLPVDQEPDFAAVRAAYQEVIDRYPNHLAGQEALIHQQSTWIMTLDTNATRAAVANLEKFLQARPDTRFAAAAWALLAQGFETLGEPDRQLEARIREIETLEIDPSSPAASDLSLRYWQVATTAEFLAGRLDLARTYYRKLIDEYPLDYRKFGAKQALARMDRLEESLRAKAAP